MHALRRIGHLDSLVLEAPLDLEVDLLDAGEVLRGIEVLAPMGDIENQRPLAVALEVSARRLGAGVFSSITSRRIATAVLSFSLLVS